MPVDTMPVIASAWVGCVWPREIAILDLLWWQDQAWSHRQSGGRYGRKSIPTSRFLAARWSWGRARVRSLMRDESAWSDPSKNPSMTQEQPINDPSTTQRKPKHDPDSTGEPYVSLKENPSMTQRKPKHDPKKTQAQPKDSHRRVVVTDTDTDTDTPIEDTSTRSGFSIDGEPLGSTPVSVIATPDQIAEEHEANLRAMAAMGVSHDDKRTPAQIRSTEVSVALTQWIDSWNSLRIGYRGRSARPITSTSVNARTLRARLTKAHRDNRMNDALLVPWYIWSSQSKDAIWLRENNTGLDTVVRASKWPKYLNAAGEEHDSPTRKKHSEPVANDGILTHKPRTQDKPDQDDFWSELGVTFEE